MDSKKYGIKMKLIVVTLQPDLRTVERLSKLIVLQSRSHSFNGKVFGCFMPTCLYLTVHQPAKRAILNRSSIHSIPLALDIEDV